jgi:hypothetical protein
MWNNYCRKQMKDNEEKGIKSIEELKAIMTNKEKFCEFT